MLSHYREVAHTSRQATIAVADIAEATRAPSRVHTTATNAAEADHDCGEGSRDAWNGRAEAGMGRETPDLVGPVERTLLDFGATHPDMLGRAAELERASERLIIEAAEERGPRNRTPDAVALNGSKGTATLINHAVASGHPSATSLLRLREAPQREPPEAEP